MTINTVMKTYHCERFRFLVDATDGNPENQHLGRPMTIRMDENWGENRLEVKLCEYPSLVLFDILTIF